MANKRLLQQSEIEGIFSKKHFIDAGGKSVSVSLCRLCGSDSKPLKCETKYNLTRHVLIKHKEKAKEFGINNVEETESSVAKKPGKISIRMDKNLFISSVVQWVGEGVPLNFFSKSCVNRILHPLEEALQLPHINRHNIQRYLKAVENKLVCCIVQEKRGRMVCIKADIASRKGRCVLGVNLQFIINGKMVIRTLAMVERFNRNTAENILEEIQKVLDKFEIKLEDVYSITTDNGSNFIKAGRLLRDAQQEHLESGSINFRSLSDNGDSEEEFVSDEELVLKKIDPELPK